VAVYVTAVPAQTWVAEAAMDMLTGNKGLTVMVAVFDVTGFVAGHETLDVRTHETKFPSTGTSEYVALVAPVTFEPFSFHWYAGVVPPFPTDAENATAVPEQTELAEGVMAMLTGNKGFTLSVMAFETAGFPVVQVASEVT
jgi:hypothetical protein